MCFEPHCFSIWHIEKWRENGQRRRLQMPRLPCREALLKPGSAFKAFERLNRRLSHLFGKTDRVQGPNELSRVGWILD
jgi:hypothetical protein